MFFFSSIAIKLFSTLISTLPLSQRARMERNRMKALTLKKARLTARTEKPYDAKAADRSVQGCQLVSRCMHVLYIYQGDRKILIKSVYREYRIL